ncbi:MAG: tRNA threonylcarbamoyladenosine dehydratase [Bacilli bacterium]|nr:tRNA threonylcarbamoyladenosine dehydratase [Bacilli bacterium]
MVSVQFNREDFDFVNQFGRLELLIGDKINKIKQKSILLVGLGGVGSYACESLIRSGIENITIVDSDIIDITNLNRQLMTNLSNVGKLKTDVWKDRIHSINPDCRVDAIANFIDKSNIDLLFHKKIDYVIDACDTIDTKVLLIEKCIQNNIKIISCMGTGNKMNPQRLKIVDISKTNYDKLAKIMRKKLKEKGINHTLVVSSDEPGYTKIDKTIPSNSFVPATAGLLLTSYVINDIVGDNDV